MFLISKQRTCCILFYNFPWFILKSVPSGIFLDCAYSSKSCHSLLPPSSLFERTIFKKLITKRFIPPGILRCTVPANVPISVKTSGPQALVGPKASGLEKQLAKASICCSVHGRDISRRNRTATLQFEEEDSGLHTRLKVSIMFSWGLCC